MPIKPLSIHPFSVGCIKNDHAFFAKHDDQLPSVSRTAILSKSPQIKHQPITITDWENADVQFACNAIRGVFPLSKSTLSPQPHAVIDEMNLLLGLNGGQLS